MKGYLFPWGRVGRQTYVRLIHESDNCFRVYPSWIDGKWLAAIVGNGESYVYDTPEEAMAITDKWLSKMGYVFLTEKTAPLI